jgi:hypothetical protein
MPGLTTKSRREFSFGALAGLLRNWMVVGRPGGDDVLWWLVGLPAIG